MDTMKMKKGQRSEWSLGCPPKSGLVALSLYGLWSPVMAQL